MSKEDTEPNPDWNPNLEDIIKKQGEQSQTFYWLHNESSIWASIRNNMIQIPSIILASTTGFLSATSSLLHPMVIGAMSLSVGILNTVNSYYKYSQRSEGHRMTALMYLKVFKNIEIELSLPIHQRTEAGKLLTSLRDKMSRISEVAPPIPEEIIGKYKRAFKNNRTSLPIMIVGPEKINICTIDANAVAANPLKRAGSSDSSTHSDTNIP